MFYLCGMHGNMCILDNKNEHTYYKDEGINLE